MYYQLPTRVDPLVACKAPSRQAKEQELLSPCLGKAMIHYLPRHDLDAFDPEAFIIA